MEYSFSKFKNRNPNLYVYGCDFSSSAIDILKASPEYDETKCKAFVCDITQIEADQFVVGEKQLDLIVIIFVLSAIKPEKYAYTFI